MKENNVFLSREIIQIYNLLTHDQIVGMAMKKMM